ncbi:MAG: helix-turn-helix transcriptional regulator [Pseudomonadota bacterium]
MDRQVCIQIGRRIRLLRWMSGVSQSALASAVGISPRILRSLEAGVAAPSSDLLSAIAEAQSVPVSRYFDVSDAHAAPTRLTERLN